MNNKKMFTVLDEEDERLGNRKSNLSKIIQGLWLNKIHGNKVAKNTTGYMFFTNYPQKLGAHSQL